MSGEYRPDGIEDAFAEEVRPPALPRLSAWGWARWAWRQLTSMRVALMLLMLLAVVAVPGSVLPQRPSDPAGVAQYLVEHPRWGELLDRLGFFDVYTSVWFSSIYLLLFVSLIGCILPRTAAHLRALRAAPPRTPRRFARFPAQAQAECEGITPAQAVDAARRQLRGRWRWLPRFRVVAARSLREDGQEELTVSAERGYLRETGNLAFHLCLLGLLVAVATGQLLHYRGQAIVFQGRGFANAVVDYDTFENGALFDPASLTPFSLTLDSFDATFTPFDPVVPPQSRDFTAHVTVREPDGSTRPERIKVNSPLTVDRAKIYLQGNGYAPRITVRDAAGEVAFAGAVPFLPEDAVYTSRGVLKVPDVSAGDQIGMVGYLLPTALVTEDGARSVYPQLGNPLLVLTVWYGDLGLDDGVPQNAYELDTSGMRQSTEEGPDGAERPVTLLVSPGDRVDLPDGLGTLTFESVSRYVALDLRHDPALPWILGFALGALGGLALSLFTPRRRVWVRATGSPGEPRTVVAVAGLARSEDAGLQAEVDAVLAAVRAMTGPGGDETTTRGAVRPGKAL